MQLRVPLLVVVLILGAVHAQAEGDRTAAGNHVVTRDERGAVTQDTCTNICGDVNWSGTVTSGDIFQFQKYISYALLHGSAECSEMDGHQSLNMRDLIWLAHHVFYKTAPPTCPANLPSYVVLSSNDYFVRVCDIMPAGASRVTVYPEFKSLARFASISANLKIDVEGVTPVIDSASRFIAPVLPNPWVLRAVVDPTYAYDTIGVVMMNAQWWQNEVSIEPGTYPLGYFDIVVPPVSYARRITYTLQGYPVGDNAPMMVDTGLVGWELHVETYSVRMTGDANNDGVISSSDIVEFVNYVFKAGPSPRPIPAAGDSDCSGSVTSADVLFVVNHVFKAGPPPCDVETECAIDLENWTCP